MWCANLVSQLFNELFKNNANRSESGEKRHNQNYFLEMTTVEGVYDYLMYVGKFLPLFIAWSSDCYPFRIWRPVLLKLHSIFFSLGILNSSFFFKIL